MNIFFPLEFIPITKKEYKEFIEESDGFLVIYRAVTRKIIGGRIVRENEATAFGIEGVINDFQSFLKTATEESKR